MSYMLCRSRLPLHCGRVQASGLSDPLLAFRTNYPGLNTKHCDSLRNLQLSPDVIDILPSNVVLDPRGAGPRTGLDRVKSMESDNSLALLWSQSEEIARKSNCTWLPPGFWHQPSNLAGNQLTATAALFCDKLTERSGADQYVPNCLCHQVSQPNQSSLVHSS